jgi:hypothetical protein
LATGAPAACVTGITVAAIARIDNRDRMFIDSSVLIS